MSPRPTPDAAGQTTATSATAANSSTEPRATRGQRRYVPNSRNCCAGIQRNSATPQTGSCSQASRAASCPTSPSGVDRRPRRGADRGRTDVTARQADLRSAPRLPVAVAQCRGATDPSSCLGRAQRRSPAQDLRQVHRRPGRHSHAPHHRGVARARRCVASAAREQSLVVGHCAHEIATLQARSQTATYLRQSRTVSSFGVLLAEPKEIPRRIFTLPGAMNLNSCTPNTYTLGQL